MMSATKPLCFYYLTQVVIVDDNKTFLENLPDNLNDALKYHLFCSPKEALAYLEKQKSALLKPEDFSGTADDLATGESLNINLPKIRTLSENKRRFDAPLVVIVDHDMPGMSGIEFCQKLKKHPIKKIMLTGAADHKLAVQAFNEGIIDQFIAKNEPKIFEIIDQAVENLQQQYFAEISEPIIRMITTTTFSFLGNPAFEAFFSNLIKAHKIKEYYLTDAMGSYFMLNAKDEPLHLVVQSDQQIKDYLHTAEDNDAPEEIIQAIASKKQLLCLLTENDFHQSASKWKNYLHPAKKIEGVRNGYYAVIKEVVRK